MPLDRETWPAIADYKSRLTSAETRFGFQLFLALIALTVGENVFISPASVAMLLDMLYNGAQGGSQQALAKALGLEGISLSDLNEFKQSMLDELQSSGAGIRLSIGNSLWAQKGIAFQTQFFSDMKEHYAAEVYSVDFSSPDVVPRINAWVSEKTSGKIPEIIKGVGALTRLIGVNAVYFKGLWKEPFKKERTQERAFTRSDGTRKQHPFMSLDDEFSYYRGPGFQAVCLPYAGSRLGMYVFLPDGKLSAFLTGLNDGRWAEWMALFRGAPGHLELPRFTLSYEAKLESVLEKLGMGELFDPERANLKGISAQPDGLFVSEILHKTFVDVNEEGTEAAAVTSMAATGCVAIPSAQKPFEMIVDRPFFCAIRDMRNGTILFLGAIEDPL